MPRYDHRRSRDSPSVSSRQMSSRDNPVYKILCISNLSQRFSDNSIKDALQREFGRYDVSVKVCHDENERLAYIYFRSYEDAREARHNKYRLVLFDKTVDIEPIYEHSRSVMPSSSSSSSRRRSVSPNYGPPQRSSRSTAASPPPSRRAASPPPSRRAPPPPPPYHHHHSSNNNTNTNTNNRHQQRESKKEKFPNYLHHIPPEDDDKATRTLFVGNLEVNITEAELRRIFERYGVVEDIDVKRPPPGQGNAYAFIKFLNLDIAHKAKVEMSGQYIGKFQCKIGYGKATPTTRIWVGGLSVNTSLAVLSREFDRFGSIRKIDFVKGENHAYIQYDSIDAAQAACQEMRGHTLDRSDKRLRVDFADPGPYNYFNSPSRPSNTGTGEHYNSSTRKDNSNASDGNWPTPPSANRYHSSECSDNFTERKTRNRVETYPSDANDDLRRERYEANSEPNANWNCWDDGSSPHGGDRRSKRPRTPEGDGSDRKKTRRSLTPDNGDGITGSPRRGSRGGDDKISPGGTYDQSKLEERTRPRSLCENVTTVSGLMKVCPLAWTGGLILKSGAFAAKMYLCSGDINIVDQLMKDGTTESPTLKITQRLRLDPLKLEHVTKRINGSGGGYCVFYTAPCSPNTELRAGVGEDGRTVQTRSLKNLVTYLKQKEAAGVISLTGNKDGKELSGVLYVLPPCQYATDLLRKYAPNLSTESAKEDYLVVVVVKGPN